MPQASFNDFSFAALLSSAEKNPRARPDGQ
jgi:hypothetical protein